MDAEDGSHLFVEETSASERATIRCCEHAQGQMHDSMDEVEAIVESCGWAASRELRMYGYMGEECC